MKTQVSAQELFAPYLLQIANKIEQHLPSMGPPTPMRDACAYALLNGGKRYRPALVLMIAKALGKGTDATPAALGVEFFHTASLIADDLPCMDNADFRREKPALHKTVEESVALLASYTLIAEAYGSIHRNVELLKTTHTSHPWDQIGMLALECVTLNGGIHGITGGQFEDIYPQNDQESTIREIIRKKTVTLFEIAFVFGWLFGAGELKLLPLVKQTAYHFGMALQISDDLGDMEEDARLGRKINLALALGKEGALKAFHEELQRFDDTLKQLKLHQSDVALVGDLLRQRV